MNNFQSYKNRPAPVIGQRVSVYKNLHNDLWSIKDQKSGLVLGYTNEVTLSGCSYTVGQKTRLKVIASGRKTVHAYVNGYFVSSTFEAVENAKDVTYNPYKDTHFTTRESDRKEVVSKSKHCTMLSETTSVLAF